MQFLEYDPKVESLRNITCDIGKGYLSTIFGLADGNFNTPNFKG